MVDLMIRKGSKFIVDFGSIAIPRALAKELEEKIRQLALGLLARTDFKGDVHLGFKLPPETYGIIFRDEGDEGEGDAPAITSPSRKKVIFPSKLASSKAAGIKAIRISRVKHDIQYEQLDERNQTIIGFVLHPIVDERNKLTAATLTRMGSGKEKGKLGAADRSARALIVDELSQFTRSSAEGGETGGEVLLSWWGVIGTGISCGLAAIEGGANILEDGACAAGIIDVVEEDDDDDD